MNPIAPFDAAWSLVPFLLVAAIILGVVLLIWVIYTIVWMGVRRGLEEYYGPGSYRGFTPPAGGDGSAPSLPGGEGRHRSGRLSR